MVKVKFRTLADKTVVHDLPDSTTLAQLLHYIVTELPELDLSPRISGNNYYIKGKDAMRYPFDQPITDFDGDEFTVHIMRNLSDTSYTVSHAKMTKNHLLEELILSHVNDEDLESLENAVKEMDLYIHNVVETYDRCKEVLRNDERFRGYYCVWDQNHGLEDEDPEYYGFKTFSHLVNYVRTTRYRKKDGCIVIPNPETHKAIPEPWSSDYICLSQGPTYDEISRS